MKIAFYKFGISCISLLLGGLGGAIFGLLIPVVLYAIHSATGGDPMAGGAFGWIALLTVPFGAFFGAVLGGTIADKHTERFCPQNEFRGKEFRGNDKPAISTGYGEKVLLFFVAIIGCLLISYVMAGI